MNYRIFILTLLILRSAYSFAQQRLLPPEQSSEQLQPSADPSPLGKGYYLVGGVFRSLSNASNFKKYLEHQNLPVHLAFSEINQRYYVYFYQSALYDDIKDKYYKVRQNPELGDSWILKVSGEDMAVTSGEQLSSDIKTKEENIKPEQQDLLADHSSAKNMINLFVNLHDEENKKITAGIQILNGESGKTYQTIPSNEWVRFSHSRSEDQLVQLEFQDFAYRKTSLDLQLDQPLNDSSSAYVRVSGDSVIIDMMTAKHKKGDIMVMYNIFFFPNSNAMRLKSNSELLKILSMMKDNPDMRIKIHGHTNGNASGLIRELKEDTEDLFSEHADSYSYKGSAAKLSLLRAITIRKYLLLEGIEEDRIEVKGWGGKKMLYKEDSPMDDYNIRVEIEVLNDPAANRNIQALQPGDILLK